MDPGEQTFRALLDAIAARTPTPGGGAAAAMAGELACALASMVVNYSIGRKDLAAHETELRAALATLAIERSAMEHLAAEDARAYGEMNEAMQLPKGSPERPGRLAEAALAATRPPMDVLRRSVALLELFEELCTITNRNLRSDLAIAAVLAESAGRSAAWNIRANLPSLERAEADAIGQGTDKLLRLAGEKARVIEKTASS
ncbi:MAG TPA: cyclodeaminase/cyclohydrolase family protein [Phycisphaerales bacterium]|nr:cyclodeaminase/cyclohydrolase family protein [Phycisphaerales bacterium]